MAKKKAPKQPELPEPQNVLYRIKRGLCGYVSYLAACEMNEAFSEYVLYEPILRILTSRRFNVKCERMCPNIGHALKGDKKKVDFMIDQGMHRFVIEVKWARKKTINVETDVLKLNAYRTHQVGNRGFLCVFGTESVIKALKFSAFKSTTLASVFTKERGQIVVAGMQRTQYACRIYEVT